VGEQAGFAAPLVETTKDESPTSCPDRGHEKLPTGGHLIPHLSGSGLTVRCSCIVECREGAGEERKDAGGDHRLV
jgi:hypothetical protein